MALGTLKLWRDRFIWTSPRNLGGDTSRPAIAVLIGGWGDLHIGHEGRMHSGRAIAVAPQVLRSIRADQGFYSLNLDPIHIGCRALQRDYFARQPLWDLSPRLGELLRARVAAAIRMPEAGLAAYRQFPGLLGGFDLRALTIPASDRTPFEGLVSLVGCAGSAPRLRRHLAALPPASGAVPWMSVSCGAPGCCVTCVRPEGLAAALWAVGCVERGMAQLHASPSQWLAFAAPSLLVHPKPILCSAAPDFLTH